MPEYVCDHFSSGSMHPIPRIRVGPLTRTEIQRFPCVSEAERDIFNNELVIMLRVFGLNNLLLEGNKRYHKENRRQILKIKRSLEDYGVGYKFLTLNGEKIPDELIEEMIRGW